MICKTNYIVLKQPIAVFLHMALTAGNVDLLATALAASEGDKSVSGDLRASAAAALERLGPLSRRFAGGSATLVERDGDRWAIHLKRVTKMGDILSTQVIYLVVFDATKTIV